MSFEVWNEYQVIPTMWRDPDIRFGSQKSILTECCFFATPVFTETFLEIWPDFDSQ